MRSKKSSTVRAKAQSTANRNNNNRSLARNRKLSINRQPALDQQALSYARLLADPCHAPLVHPVYSGSDGGYLVRFEVLTGVGIASATTTSGLLHWAPGAQKIVGSLNNSDLYLESTAPTISGTATGNPFSITPGAAFMGANTSAYRCVAACMTVTWAGSELTRSGYIGMGNTTGSLIRSGDAVAPSVILPLLTEAGRTPDNSMEIRWRPSDFDQTFSSSASPPTDAELAKSAGLTMYYSGLPAGGAGLLVRKTAVYEYVPNVLQGLATVPTSRNTSANTLDQVVNFLDKNGDWMVSGLKSAGRAAIAAYPYVRTLGAIAL